MGVVALPYTFTPDTAAHASEVMADLVAILNAVNGGIDGDNAVTGTAVAVSSGSSAGSGTDLALANHTHDVQGVERLAADPSTGNFVGREYFNTITLEKRICIATGGAGTWLTTGNPTATELVIHAAQHAVGGHDPLPDNIIADAMKGSAAIVTAQIGGDVTIPADTWTTLVDLSVTTTGVQTLDIDLNVKVSNSSGTNKPGVVLRVVDVTASNVTIYRCPGKQQMGISGGGSDAAVLSRSFKYATPAGGARTLRLQMDADATGMKAIKPVTINTDAVSAPAIEAAIL